MPDRLAAILRNDPLRLNALAVLAALHLPDAWIAAGFVREAVWDHLHGRPPGPPQGDVDVVWFDRERTTDADDRRLETALVAQRPALAWSVKNQARMHIRNGDPPYRHSTDAMRHWPETATAVGARLAADGSLEIAAPFGLDDLFGLVVRPTPAFVGAKRPIYQQRVADKRWLVRWPGLRER
jgi:uncharacterized protein